MKNNAVVKTVGEKVFVVRNSYSGDCYYNEGVVVKVTPGGLMDVRVGGFEGTPTRFNGDGRALGTLGSRPPYIDRMPFDERVSYKAREIRARAAADAMRLALVDKKRDWEFVDFTRYSAENMLEMLAEREAKIAAARLLVAAIDAPAVVTVAAEYEPAPADVA